MQRITLDCDECRQAFEVRMDIGLNMLANQENDNIPVVCPVCYPEEPYEEEVDSI